jgi:hypothetical protein
MDMKSKAAQQLGKLGGQKTASLYGKEHFKKIAKGWPKGKKRKLKGGEMNDYSN